MKNEIEAKIPSWKKYECIVEIKHEYIPSWNKSMNTYLVEIKAWINT